MIEKVRLENFISHVQTEIELSQGVNVFLGHNGAGKSSVIDAITYALYGKHTRKETKNLVRTGSTNAAVSVLFSIRNKKYKAERRIDSRGRLISGVLSELSDGETKQIVAGERRQMEESMSEEIRKITGLDFDMMKVATIVQQGELDKIVTEYKPSEVKNLINEVIGIEKLELGYQEMRDVINEFKRRLRAKYYNYDTDNVEQLNNKIINEKLEIQNLGEELKRIENRISLLEEKENKLKERLNSLERLKTKVEQLKQQRANLFAYVESKRKEIKVSITELESKVKRAKESLTMVKDKDTVSEELEDIVSEIEAKNEEEKECVKSLAELESIDIRSTEEAKVTLERRIEKKSKDIEELSKKIEELSSIKKPAEKEEIEQKKKATEEKIQKLTESLHYVKAKIEDYEKLKQTGVCPVCDTDVSQQNVEEKIRIKLEEQAQLEQEIELLNQSQIELQNLLDEFERYVDAQSRIAEYISYKESAQKEKEEAESELRGVISKLESEKKKLQSLPELKEKEKILHEKIKQLKRRQDELNSKLNEIKLAERFLQENGIASEEDIKKIESDLAELKRKLSNIPEDIEKAELEKLKIDSYSEQLINQVLSLIDETKGYDEKDYISTSKEYEDLTKELNKAREEKGSLGSKIKALHQDLEQLIIAKNELKEASNYVKLFETIRNEIYNRDGALATGLRSWAIKHISTKASEYVKSFSIGISQIELKEGKREVEIYCYGERGQIDVNSMSGGEKVAIALALRFAIADLIGKGNIDFIVFDEPTTHLDKEKRKLLVNMISSAGGQKTALNQIIIITHDEEIFENADIGTIYEFERIPGLGTTVKKL